MGFSSPHFAFFDSMSLQLVTTLSRGLTLGAHSTALAITGLKPGVNEKAQKLKRRTIDGRDSTGARQIFHADA